MANRSGLYGDERICIRCDRPYVHRHHIFYGTGRRSISEREGCWAYLCPEHHNMSNHGVHFDHRYDMRLKADCQRRWVEREMDEEGIGHDDATERFRSLFGRSYEEDQDV